MRDNSNTPAEDGEKPHPAPDLQGMPGAEMPDDIGERVSRVAHVSSVFGEPYKVGDKTFIPVAQVRVALGFGAGPGQAPASHGEPGEAAAPGRRQKGPRRGMRGGPGGGGRAAARPVALVEISHDQVRVKELTNRVPVAIAGILLGGWNVYWLFSTIREWLKKR